MDSQKIFPSGAVAIPELLLVATTDTKEISTFKKVYRAQRLISSGDSHGSTLAEQIITEVGQLSLKASFTALLDRHGKQHLSRDGLNFTEDILLMFMERKFNPERFKAFVTGAANQERFAPDEGLVIAFPLSVYDVAWLYHALEADAVGNTYEVFACFQRFQHVFDTELQRDLGRLYKFKMDFGVSLPSFSQLFSNSQHICYPQLLKHLQSCKAYTVYILAVFHRFVSTHFDGLVFSSTLDDVGALQKLFKSRRFSEKVHCHEIREALVEVEVFCQ